MLGITAWSFGLQLGLGSGATSNWACVAFTSTFLTLSFITIWNCLHEPTYPENSARPGTSLSMTELTHYSFLNAKDGGMRWDP